MKKKTVSLLNKLKAKPLLMSGAFLCLPIPFVEANITQQISGVQNEISRQEKEIKEKNKKVETLQSLLKTQEKSIAALSRQIINIDSNLRTLADEIAELKKENRKLEIQKKSQIAFLENLFISQYRQGRHASISAILGADSSKNYDRMTTYVEHLSKERAAMIIKLTEIDKELDQKYERLAEQTARQTNLREKSKKDNEKLKQEKLSLQQTRTLYQQQISSHESNISELRANKAHLQKELNLAQEKEKERARIAKEKKTVRMDGLSKYKGKLEWPVKGDILHRYGSAQTGPLNWNGIVISAREGTEVKATHDGTVVLSNWLRGYGLMLVIDHGQGDMSFYGFNQVLLRDVGDQVKAGEPIARVGNTGGQSSSGLYFEIRRKGNATNPTPWLKR